MTLSLLVGRPLRVAKHSECLFFTGDFHVFFLIFLFLLFCRKWSSSQIEARSRINQNPDFHFSKWRKWRRALSAAHGRRSQALESRPSWTKTFPKISKNSTRWENSRTSSPRSTKNNSLRNQMLTLLFFVVFWSFSMTKYLNKRSGKNILLIY